MSLSIRIGTSAITKTNDVNNSRTNEQFMSDSYFTATVIDTLLLDSQRNSFFEDIDDKSSLPLGTIKFQKTYTGTPQNDLISYAIPVSLHTGLYPRIGEMVKIAYDNTYEAQSSKGTFIRIYYYIEVISAWSSVEHNIVPKNDIYIKESTDPSINTYKTTETGVVKSDKPDGNIKFKERGDIKNLIPLSDNIIQGRGGNSIRMGTSDDSIKDIPWKGDFGNPVLIFRNGQKQSENQQVFEDINLDGSSLYFLNNQTINFIAASSNFESHDTLIQNPSNIVEPKIQKPDNNTSNANFVTSSIKDAPPTSYQVSTASMETSPVTSSVDEELERIPDSDDEIQYVSRGTEIPITNGVIDDLGKVIPVDAVYVSSGNAITKNNNITNSGVVTLSNIKFKSIIESSGKVSNDANLSRSVRAFLDIIAYAEGTLGKGDLNGYDVYFGNNNVIKNYQSYNNAPVHPNDGIKYMTVVENGKSKDKYSSAAGRYQFIYETWIKLNGGNITLTKRNQDIAGYKRMLWNVSATKIEQASYDYNIFREVVGGSSSKPDKDSFAGIWASLPSNYAYPGGIDKKYGLFGHYGQNKSNQKSFELLWKLYQQILMLYK